jgi:hypothetical protein
MRLARFAQQLRELRELRGRQVPKLLAAATADGLVKLTKQFQAGCRNADLDDAAVVGRPASLDQAACFQLVEHPRDVRRGETSRRANDSVGTVPGCSPRKTAGRCTAAP